MAADRELALPMGAARLRDFARRHGLAEFWSWWIRELAALVPSRPRAAVQRRRMRPVLAFDTDTATLWRPVQKDGRVTMMEVATVPLSADPVVLADARAAVSRVLGRAGSATTPGPKIVVALSPRTTLRKTLVVPAAVEGDLRQALGYDLDRHTPFKPDELYFDAAVMSRDNAHAQIRVELVAARRAHVDAAIRHAQSLGTTVVAVVPDAPTSAAASRFNLLPQELRQNGARWKRWQIWVPIGALVAVALIAVLLPLWQKREYAIALNEVAGQAFQQASVSESLRNELDRQVNDYNFALERKYAFPSAVQILDDVTRLLPDDTWLTQLEIKTTGRGKEAQHELLVRGESANAGRLVTLLEDSKLFTQAAPRSPTTKIQPGPGEIFDVGAQLKPLPQPPLVRIATNELPASTANSAAAGARAPNAAAVAPVAPAATPAPAQPAPPLPQPTGGKQ